MALEVFCGRFQPDLEAAFIARLKAAPPGLGRRVAIVTPSRRLADRLQKLVALEHGLPAFNIRFHTFFSLALEIVSELPGEEAVIADGLFHDKLIDGLLRERLGGARMTRGLAAAYRASLRDLIDAGVDAPSVREHFGDYLEKSRLGELLRLSEEYQSRLSELGVMPPAGLARRATSAVNEGRAARLEDYAEFIYYGFYDLTGAQADLFSAVTGAYPSAVFFPYRADLPMFAFARRFFELKLSAGKVRTLKGEPGGALGESLDCLFDPAKSAPPAEPGRLKIASAAGTRDQVWAAAKEILRLTEEGYAFCDIGVAARTLEPYAASIIQVFSEHAIPFSLGEGAPLLSHPAAKLALSLLSLRRSDFPVGRVFDLVESPYFRAQKHGGARTLSNWRRLASRLGVHSGWLQWVGKISSWAEKDFELREGVVISKHETAKLWKMMESLHDRLDPKSRAAWGQHCRRARELLEEFFEMDAAAPAWAGVLAAMAELEGLGALFVEASWGEFLEAFEEKLRRAALAVSPENCGVRVMNAMDARGESFRALIIIGLNDGIFPRQVREDPLLGDLARARLRHPAGYWIAPKLEGFEEEKLIFGLLAASARERLCCVYARSDDDGRAQVPSIYLRELCRACEIDLEESALRVPRQPFARIESQPPRLWSPKEISLMLAQGGQSAASFLAPLGGDGAFFDACLEPISALRAGGEVGSLDGIIGRPDAFLKSLAQRGLSPTALDSLSACPFQFFASRLLGLGEEQEPSERGELAAWLKGTIYHRILERLHADLKRRGFWSAPDDSWRAALSTAIDETFKENGWRQLGVYPLLWRSLKARMSYFLEGFVESDIAGARTSGLIPALFERELLGQVDGRRFHGKADRIDIDEAGRRFRVVDYKSTWSATRPPLEKLALSMRAQQPAVYLELAGRELEGLEPYGASYCAVEEDADGLRRPQEFSGAQWRRVRSAIWRNIENFVGHMERGEFFIAPGDERGGACEYCDYHWVCRKAHPASRRRAENSSLRAAFNDSHEVLP